MASSRVTSLPALNKLATAGSKRQFRGLHMTGANSNPSPLLASQTLPTYSSRAVADLKTECMNRNIAAGGAKAEVSVHLISDPRY